MNKPFIWCLFYLGLLPVVLRSQQFEQFQKLEGHLSAVTALCFHQEAGHLYSGDATGTILIWNISDGTLIKRLNEHNKKITHLELSSDKKLLVSASYDGTCKIWNLGTNQLVQTITNTSIPSYAQVKGMEPTFVGFSATNDKVFYGGYNMQINSTAIPTNTKTELFRTTLGGITSGTLNANKTILAFGLNQEVHLYDLVQNRLIKTLKNTNTVTNYICEIAFIPSNNNLLATWTYGGRLQIWNLASQQIEKEIIPTALKGSSEFSFAPNGQFLVTGNKGNSAVLWDAQTYQKMYTLNGHLAPVKSLAISQNSEYIATGSKDHHIRLWKKPTIIPPTPPIVTEPPSVETAEILNQADNRAVEVQGVFAAQSDKIKVTVYDFEESDGDVLSLIFNERLVLKEYTISRNKKILELQVTQADNYLIAHAHNEGRIPPNTIAIEVESHNQRKSYRLRSNMNTSAALRVTLSQ